MPSRRHARELALQALYGAEIGHRPASEMIDETVGTSAAADTRVFVRDLVLGTLENEAESDAIISPLLEGSTIDRIVLRMSVFELRHFATPGPVVINEAVELAKKFSTEDSGRFVNGVLAKAQA
jgi:N utilization substance protein B